jgi:hypothetical protein
MTSTNPKASIISHSNNNGYLLANPSIKPYTVLGSEELELMAARGRTAAGRGENNGKGQRKRKIKIEMNGSVPQIEGCFD